MFEELVDVLAPDGTLTGVAKSKAAVHRDGNWHQAVHVWLFDGDGVVLQRRSRFKENFPNRWDVSFAGHVHAGESASDAAVREATEELHLQIKVDDLQFLANRRSQHILLDGTYIDNEFQAILVLRQLVEVRSLVPDTSEVSELRSLPRETFSEWVVARHEELVPHWIEYELILAQWGQLRERIVSAF